MNAFLWIMWSAVAVFIVLIVGGSLLPESSKKHLQAERMCREPAEAAHYIAAKSGLRGDVTQVVNDVVADRKYPELGDKGVAGIGLIVTLGRGRKTPDEISYSVRAACEKEFDAPSPAP